MYEYLQKLIRIGTWVEKKVIFVGILKVKEEEKDPKQASHPDPLVKGTDPRIRFRIQVCTNIPYVRDP
jgi:hypothetical protein